MFKVLKFQRFMAWTLMFFCFFFCFSGCVPKKEWVLRCGNNVIFSGEYAFLMSSVLLEANARILGNRGSFEDVDFNLKKLQSGYIENDTVFNWAKKEALKRSKQFLLTQLEYDRMNLSGSEAANRRFQSAFSSNFDSEFSGLNMNFNFSKFGCSKETMYAVSLDSVKKSTVFEEYFGVGKPWHNRIDENAVKNFTNQNFIKFKSIKISKNVNSPEYAQNNDEKAGSKLSTIEGVNTPQELAEKYLNELNNSVNNIDEISKRYAKLTGSKEEQEIKPIITYKFSDKQESYSTVDEEVKKFVNEIEPESKPVLKENENFYFILQRYNLDEGDLSSQKGLASKILSGKEIEKLLEELDKRYGKKIEINEKMVNKYSAEKMADRIAKYKPKADKKPGMFF